MFGRLISNQINPHFTFWEALRAASWLFRSTPKGAVDFSPYFKTPNYILGSRARDLLREAIIITKPDKAKKIGAPAFICAVAVLPFIAEGYEIEWLDTDENGVLSVDEFKSKAAGLSAVLVPHVFGQEAPLKAIYDVAKAQPHEVLVIEDGAHHWRTTEMNAYFDLKFLSFGREKVVSCVSGGALIWPENSQWSDKLSQCMLPSPPKRWERQHLIQPLVYSIALPWWHLGGKVLPMICLKLGILPMAVTKDERFAEWTSKSYGLSYKLQQVLKSKIKRLPKELERRSLISDTWVNRFKEASARFELVQPSSSFRVILKNLSPKDLTKIRRNKSWHLAEWNGNPIGPAGVDTSGYGYKAGACPNAEKFAQNHCTLPTHRRVKVRDIDHFFKNLN